MGKYKTRKPRVKVCVGYTWGGGGSMRGQKGIKTKNLVKKEVEQNLNSPQTPDQRKQKKTSVQDGNKKGRSKKGGGGRTGGNWVDQKGKWKKEPSGQRATKWPHKRVWAMGGRRKGTKNSWTQSKKTYAALVVPISGDGRKRVYVSQRGEYIACGKGGGVAFTGVKAKEPCHWETVCNENTFLVKGGRGKRIGPGVVLPRNIG